jgi:hypothetical protein
VAKVRIRTLSSQVLESKTKQIVLLCHSSTAYNKKIQYIRQKKVEQLVSYLSRRKSATGWPRPSQVTKVAMILAANIHEQQVTWFDLSDNSCITFTRREKKRHLQWSVREKCTFLSFLE